MIKMLTVCFTGHRPNKLYGYDINNNKYKLLRKVIIKEVINIINTHKNEKSIKFISGGALGLDQLAADIIQTGREHVNKVHLISEIAIPFKNQPAAWFNKTDIRRYEEQLKDADIITYVDKIDKYKVKGLKEEEYHPVKMKKRNEYMVDNSDIIIAVWNGDKQGGTYNCIEYAKILDKDIIYINPRKIK